MAKKHNGFFKNENGCFTERELVDLIHTGELDSYLRAFRLKHSKCPPERLRESNQQCFYCMSCYKKAIKQVKEYSKYYKIGNVKYDKEDLTANKEG